MYSTTRLSFATAFFFPSQTISDCHPSLLCLFVSLSLCLSVPLSLCPFVPSVKECLPSEVETYSIKPARGCAHEVCKYSKRLNRVKLFPLLWRRATVREVLMSAHLHFAHTIDTVVAGCSSMLGLSKEKLVEVINSPHTSRPHRAVGKRTRKRNKGGARNSSVVLEVQAAQTLRSCRSWTPWYGAPNA